MDSLMVDIFCRVVDNFGDIGVAYRLSRQLRRQRPHWKFRLTVSDLETFRQLEPRLDPHLTRQTIDGLEIHLWEEARTAPSPPPEVVIENFGEGWPAGFGSGLMDPLDPRPRVIINLDYLSAEDYAEEFHKLPSLTPLPQVRKFFFMPGFTPGTGGLMLGEDFRGQSSPGEREEWLRKILPEPPGLSAEAFWISLFSYEHDYTPLVESLRGIKRPAGVLLAQGRGKAGFLQAWHKLGKPLPVLELPFLAQGDYDRLVSLCDFNIVRGEESLVRACVSGIPFLWHAYLQEDAYQRVKVEALLERLAPHFSGSRSWEPLRSLFLDFNHRYSDTHERAASERFSPVFDLWEEIKRGFQSFGNALWEQGDLTENLAEFIEEKIQEK